MASKQISTEEWREFLGNEATELSRILSPYAELILKDIGFKPSFAPTARKRFEYKGNIVELEKNRDGGHDFRYVENNNRKVSFLEVLRDSRKDAGDNFEHVNKARKYAFKYDAGSYKKFLASYPEISDRILRHGEVDTPDVRAQKAMQPKTYKDLARQFLLSNASIFSVAAELGFKPKEMKPGVDFIPKEVVNKVLQHVDLKEVIEKFQGKMFFQDGKFATHSPFAEKGQDALLQVNAQGTTFYCEATQKGGNAITFLMDKEKYEFVESVKYLAGMYHVDLDKELAAAKKETQVFYVKDESRVVLKVQENGVHTFYNTIKGEGGNVIKFLEAEASLNVDQAFGFLKNQVEARVIKGNIDVQGLVSFVRKASELAEFDKVLANPDSLVNMLGRESSEVASQLEKLKESKSNYSVDSVAEKFKVPQGAHVAVMNEPAQAYDKGNQVKR